MKVYITMVDMVDREDDCNSTIVDTVWTKQRTARDRLRQMVDEYLLPGYDGYEVEAVSEDAVFIYEVDTYVKYYILERDLEDH